MEKITLTPEAISAIEYGLSQGYDIEVRKCAYGVSVATNQKKVTYKENSPDNRESVKEPRRTAIR